MRRLIAVAVLATLLVSCADTTAAGPDRPVRILTGEPTTLDPAAQGDAGSAAITAQLFESLTAFDADLRVQPALAESWRFDDGGRRLTFHLRPGLTFSDGTPLRASDVVRSWLRLIDPDHPSPLASLVLDVAGAEAYLRGTSTDPASVGLRADDAAGDLVVDLVRPATDFVNIVAGPSFGIVPPQVADRNTGLAPGPDFVSSGGYVLTGSTGKGLNLTANDRYWAGRPAISKIELVADLAGGSPVEAFAGDELDLTGVSSIDASWIAYDKTLGPQLRRDDSLAVQYYGFDASKPPFDDVRVRRAFGEAIDWRRMAGLSGTSETVQVANSMVPPGIPGRSDADFVPRYDPADARKQLADAGFPGGAGFPDTTLMTGGSGFDQAIVEEVHRELGITLHSETMGDGYFQRLTDRAAGDLVAGVGRRLSRAQRLPRRPARDRRIEQLRALELGGVRCRHHRGRVGHRPVRRERRLRPGRGDRPRRCPGRAAVVRPGLVADAEGPARGRPERSRDRAHGGAGVGGVMRRRIGSLLVAAVLLIESCARDLGRRLGRLRDADSRIDVRRRRDLQPARDAEQGGRPRRAPRDHGRRDRPDRDRGHGHAGPGVVDAHPPARSLPIPSSWRTPRSSPSGASSPATTRPTCSSGPR